jgi:proline-rich protein PRCC
MANEAALERLAGRLNKRRKQDEGLGNIIDVNFEDIKPDEREWVTKALTEDDDDKPGPRNTIGGNQKRKHQITYLAAMAKENEQNLKKQWAAGAANRRAASSKYGF